MKTSKEVEQMLKVLSYHHKLLRKEKIPEHNNEKRRHLQN